MVPKDFDQTNGKVDGLKGDDGGVIAPPVPDSSVEGFLQKVMRANPPARGSSIVDKDPSVTAYSEEGTP